MKLAIANDHAATAQKLELAAVLSEAGHEVVNLGTDEDNSVDYPDFAAKVCEQVRGGKVDCGILICGTGIGMSIAANKVRGIRAALCHSVETAQMSREHNNANVLCLGARVLDFETLKDCALTFLSTDFAGGRHAMRLDKICAFDGEA